MSTPEHSVKKLPLASKVIFAVTALSAILYVAFLCSPAFADAFNGSVSTVFRFLLAKLTGWLPFSVAELCIILIPLAVAVLIVIAYRHYCNSWRNTLVYIGIILSIVCIFLNLFVWTFAAGYHGRTLDQKLGLDRRPVSAEELYDTAEILAAELRDLSDEIDYMPNGASVMPYSVSEMNDKLLDAYDRVCEEYDFIDRFSSRLKPVMLSEPMSYTHITGVYTFFTGEANINVNFPDYTIPYTAAHELAHQRGIAREDEANFVAFLVCLASDDPYIRYSGVLGTYEFIMSALYSADYEGYAEIWQTVPDEIHGEQAAYSAFFDKYRDNLAASVSNATNDAYLKGQGAVAGTRSYSMVVDLAVAYYREK
ncbi:MAG: DUF3810 domain-containing protein [Clostridia bacterium]|nr:DUF3810 domain-containing protein [Clostridia bacterium]